MISCHASSQPDPDSSDDLAQIVAQAQRGHAHAVTRLVESYQRRIAGFVLALIDRRDDVDDVCQSVFVKMIERLPSLRDPQAFEPWLFQIARRACADHGRAQRWRALVTRLLPIHHETIAESSSETPESVVRLREALRQLPLAQRELLALWNAGQLSYEDMARVTGLNLGALKTRLFRAREALKQRLTHERP